MAIAASGLDEPPATREGRLHAARQLSETRGMLSDSSHTCAALDVDLPRQCLGPGQFKGLRSINHLNGKETTIETKAIDREALGDRLRKVLAAEFEARWPGMRDRIVSKGSCWVLVPSNTAELKAIRGRPSRRTARERQALSRSCGNDLCVILAHIGKCCDHVTPANTKLSELLDDLLLSPSSDPFVPLGIVIAEGCCRGCVGPRVAVLVRVLEVLTDSAALQGRIIEDWVWELAGSDAEG